MARVCLNQSSSIAGRPRVGRGGACDAKVIQLRSQSTIVFQFEFIRDPAWQGKVIRTVWRRMWRLPGAHEAIYRVLGLTYRAQKYHLGTAGPGQVAACRPLAEPNCSL